MTEMDTYEGRRGEPLSLHKYLYAHANPVMNVDPSGEVSIGGVFTAISVISIGFSTYNAIVEPNALNIGLLAFDIATVGYGSRIVGLARVAKAMQVERARKLGSTLIRAFPGGKAALDAYKWRLTGTVLGTYDEMLVALRNGAKRGVYQANHINQQAAFPGILKGHGLAIPMKGMAKEVGTQHWRFHKNLDDFWDAYRGTNRRPSADQYREALKEALHAGGVNFRDSMNIAEAALAQARHAGYFGGGLRVKIPGRTTVRTR